MLQSELIQRMPWYEFMQWSVFVDKFINVRQQEQGHAGTMNIEEFQRFKESHNLRLKGKPS